MATAALAAMRVVATSIFAADGRVTVVEWCLRTLGCRDA